MKIILNGEEKVISEGKNILQLLEEFKLSPMMVAVELNEKIIKREYFSSTEIKKDDKIEIVRMMGGG
ncbi:MAG: sulfur carrier protein ThiS [bacterium]|nr:sulfur carrier protein ThiS [bacterium]